MRCVLWFPAWAVCLALVAAAEPAGRRAAGGAEGPVDAEQGSVSRSGKFSPKGGEPVPHQPAPSRDMAEQTLRQALRVEVEGPGRYRIGAVHFDRTLRTVTIPARVNMDSGVVEYALVHESGKVHEAILSTRAKPEEVHLACLLLGMAPLAAPAALAAGAELPAAQRIEVKVAWDTNGPPAEHPLSRLVLGAADPAKPADGAPLAEGPWLYNGSAIDAAGFAAAREGSVIALITDPSALVNNTRQGCGNDQFHLAHRAVLPRKGSPVRVVLTLPAAAPRKDPP
jgi:hypothetical protein